MTAWGRAIRTVMTVLVGITLLAGTVAGGDTDFPFGPFAMFSTTDKINAPVKSSRVDAIDASGEHFVLGAGLSGLRRAEIEGLTARIVKNPELLGDVADAYARRNPGKPLLTQVTLVVRNYDLVGGVPTGAYEDTVLATWRRP